MSLIRRPPVDQGAVKRSRAGCTGAITKALDRLKAIPVSTAEEVALINSKEVDRILNSIQRTETSFLQTREDALAFIPEDEEESFQREEEAAGDSFSNAISATRDLGDQLLCLKAVLNGIANFTSDMEAIQDTLTSKPDSNQKADLQDLKAAFTSLRSQWQAANLPKTHPLKAELDSCRRELANLGADITAASDKSDIHSETSSSASSHGPCYIVGKNDLPTIDVPKFSGNILGWSSFWSSFKSTIQDRKELSNTQRLHYLRQAISDPELQLLLHSPAETPDYYLEVVEELKERFAKNREIHKLLSRTLADLASPKQTRTDLRRVVDLVKRTISSMKATKQYDMDSFLSSLLSSVLPPRLQTSWAQHTKKDKLVPPISQLLTYLREHAETLPESGAPLSAPPSDSPPWKNNPRRSDKRQDHHKPKVVHAVTTTSNYKWECTLCSPEKHPLHACPKWASYSVSQRLAQVKARKLCSNCLAGGHSTNNCKSTYRCRDCGQQHHTTIHQESAAATPVNSACSTSRQVPDALMTTAQVLLKGPRGQEIQARALIDSGAGLSLISHKMAQTLGLPLSPSKLQLTGVQGTSCKPIKFLTQLTISPLHNKEKQIQCSPAVVQVVTSDLPPERMDPVHELPHMLGLHLADVHYNVPGRIDILLGADMAPQVMTRRMLQTGKDTEPIAQATEFGWVISGPATRSQSSSTSYAANHTSLQVEESPSTNDLIFGFWKAEEVPGDEEPSLSSQEEQAELHYAANTTYSSKDCRYQVTLPKKPDLFPLGDSRAQAASRYLANEKSLLKRNLWEPFQQVVQQYVDLGHAEKVPLSESPSTTTSYYLPMHAVLKDSSTTTKLRVVFDGSAITTSGTSLNQALLVGPTIQPTLSDILLRFRCYPIALNADISKMYREVQLHPLDKDLHRFVWRASPTDPLQDFRMCRVTFGVSASPYLAVRTLQQTARDHGEGYPEVTQHILNNFYVDDFLGGASSTQEASTLFKDIRSILKKGGFNLTKWKEVLQNIPEHLQESATIKDSTSINSITPSKALGLIWDSALDVMSPSINVSSTYTLTKRGVFRDVSKTYDVLGWISPTVLTMKILFQSLWKTGQDWDDDIPADLAELHQQ